MPAISSKNLTKKFRSFKAVDNLSFNIDENHVVGFLGPNGAGKTTTLRMLVGLSKPTGGEIEISGEKVLFGGSKINRNIGYLPELPAMYRWMSGYEYLQFLGKIFKMSAADRKAKIAEVLEIAGLEKAKNKRISTYSGGMVQRLGVAQALLNDPKVLILDEPVSALDPIGRKEVLDVIERSKQNRTVLFSTHILSDVDRICDDVVMINEGKLVVASPLAELKSKYAAPILEVDFLSDPTSIATMLKRQKWVAKLEQNGNKMRVWLNDRSVITSNVPLNFMASSKIGILRYGLTLPETEDLFIDLLEKQQ